MAFLRVTGCCCGCSLSQGTKVVAALGLVWGLLGLLAMVYLWTAGYFLGEHAVVTVLRMASQGGSIALSGLLLLGAQRRKPGFVLAWLVVQGVGLALLCLALPLDFVAMLWALVQGGSWEVFGWIVLALGVAGAALSLSVYIYAVVYSFYHELKEEAERGQHGLMVPSSHLYEDKTQDPEYGYPIDVPPAYKEKEPL